MYAGQREFWVVFLQTLKPCPDHELKTKKQIFLSQNDRPWGKNLSRNPQKFASFSSELLME